MAAVQLSPQTIKDFKSYASECFAAHYIQDEAVKDAVSKMILTDSTFLDLTTEKFAFEGQMFDIVSGKELASSTDTSRRTVELHVSLTPTQKAVLANNNPDYNIVYKESLSKPHAMAYAQRVVDTHRCRNSVNYSSGVVLDIGGNYATHAMNGANRIHSCTLNADVEEMHRQTQRDVNLKHGEFTQPSYCVNGVQFCEVMAAEAFSLHTFPRIDPKDVVRIFNVHNLQFITGVHHYDPAMDYASEGYIPDVEMHWRVEGKNIRFYFENDSSYDYVHDLAFLQRYSSNGYFSHPDFEFVVYLSIEKISNGMCYWTMMRQRKDTLGTQIIPKQYRYNGERDTLILQVPKFDETLGFAITDPRAYVLKPVPTPTEFFSLLYKKSLANSSSRPDLPLSYEDVKGFAQTYNRVRNLNGTSLVESYRMSSRTIDDIAMGVYLIAVQKAAHARVAISEYNILFHRMQKRWGAESVTFLIAKCFSATAFAPFIMLANNMTEILDVIAVSMRNTIASTKTIASVTEQLPYYLLSPARAVVSTQSREFNSEVQPQSFEDEDDNPENIERFYNIFKDDITLEQRNLLLEKIASMRTKAQHLLDEPKSLVEDEMIDVDNHEQWKDAMIYMSERVSKQPDTAIVVGSTELISNINLQIYEAGLHYLDVTFATTKNAEQVCEATWNGVRPNHQLIMSRNNTNENNVKYFRVANGKVEGDSVADYQVMMDPVKKTLVYIVDGFLQTETHSDYLFAFEPFKIFHGMKMCKKYIDFARNKKSLKKYEFTLVDGIPGSAKTYEIINSAQEDDLIVCAVRESAHDTREKMIQKFPKMSPDRIRTLDSCVLNGVPLAKTLWVDEGLLSIPGTIHYVAQGSSCKYVKVFGDSEQLSHPDFGTKLGVLRYPKPVLFTSIEYRDVSVRCPADVLVAIKHFYPEFRRLNIKTMSPVRRSVTKLFLSDPDNDVYRRAVPGVATMTFTRADRTRTLSGYGFYDGKKSSGNEVGENSSVLTVHESQGSTNPHVLCVRTTPFNATIFANRQYQLVAISRHTHSFVWASVSDPLQDSFLQVVNKAVEATEEELDEVSVPTPTWLKEKIEKTKPRGII